MEVCETFYPTRPSSAAHLLTSHVIGVDTGCMRTNVYTHLNSEDHIRRLPTFLGADTAQPKINAWLTSETHASMGPLSNFSRPNAAKLCFGMPAKSEAEMLNLKHGPMIPPTTYTVDCRLNCVYPSEKEWTTNYCW